MRLRSLLSAVLALSAGVAFAQNAPASRPRILGIDHVTLYAADPVKSGRFYEEDLHAKRLPSQISPGGARYYFNSVQYVEVLPKPADHPDARFGGIAFETDDAVAMRHYLQANGMIAQTVTATPVQALSVNVSDPEGNEISFVQNAPSKTFECYSDVSCHLIHAGFLVRDRAKEDAFYRKLLGFRPYWVGASTPGRVDWVSQQVPDGQDWLEYMMTGDGSDSPLASVDRAELGGKDHISLAVDNMEATITMLLREHRLTGKYNGPQMGLDGKWQTNLYDPDGTRVELMEAKPVMQPCCSPFTAPHPSLQAR